MRAVLYRRYMGRRGQLLLGALGVVAILTLAASVHLGKQNSDMEKDALRRTQDVANGRQTRSSESAQEAAERDQKELQTNEVGRLVKIITPGGGQITDMVDLSMDADEASKYYSAQLYGPGATEAQVAIAAQKAAALREKISRLAPGLEGNRLLATYTLRRMAQQEQALERPGMIGKLRGTLGGDYAKLSDEELRTRVLRDAVLGPILSTKRFYDLAKQELRKDGTDPTPGQINKVLTALFGDSGAALNEKAFMAALSAAKALQNAGGTYTGSFSGQASGHCRVTVRKDGVQAGFTGSGALSGGAGTFSVTVNGNGPLDPATGAFGGTLSGTMTYMHNLFGTPSVGTTSVKGSFKGNVSAKGVNGSWSATALDETRTGVFEASK